MSFDDILTYSPLPLAIIIYFAYQRMVVPLKLQINENLRADMSTFQLASFLLKNATGYIGSKLWGKLFNVKNISSLTSSSYTITYYHNNIQYKYPLIVNKGPKADYKIYHQGSDITKHLLPYFGPNKDLYKLAVTPKLLGYTTLRIEKQNLEGDNQSLTFGLNDKISLSNFTSTDV